MRIETRDGKDYYVWDMTIPAWTPEPSVATLTFTEPWMDMSTNYTITNNLTASALYEDVTIFKKRSPKADDRLAATKLTANNLNDVGAQILHTAGGLVEVLEDGLSVGNIDQGEVFKVGTWLVEDYDFVADKAYFRAATLEERIKYNLR